MRAGDVFAYYDGSDKHLWVVISDPEIDATAFVVTVNLTSYGPTKEPACLLGPEDCPEFITHQTCVFYEEARPVSLVVLRRHLDSGKIVKQGAVTAEVLEKIRCGAANTRRIPEGCRKILVEQGLIQ